MNKLLLLIVVFFTSCKSVILQKKQPIPEKVDIQTDVNQTILGVSESDVNIFNPNYFSPGQVLLIILFIIFLLCFASLSPYISKFLKKKRS